LAILLLSTPACHLCELAQDILQQVFNQQDILALSEKADLHIYLQDEKIPVLLDESSSLTLEWPFDTSEVAKWLEKVAANTGSLSV
jgi:hypothetical protein